MEKSWNFILYFLWEPWGNWNSCKGKVREVCSVLWVGTLGNWIHVREKSGKFVLSNVWEPWGNWNSCKGKVREVCCVLCVGTLGKLEFMSGKIPGSLLCPMCGNPGEIWIHVRERSGKFVVSYVWEPWGNWNSCQGKVREVCCVLCVGTLGKLEFMSGKSPGSLLCPMCGNPGEIGIHVREKSGKFVLSYLWEPWGNWNSCQGKVREVCSVLCVGTLGKLEFMSGKIPGSLLCPMCGNPGEIGIHVREKSGKFVLSCVWEPWGNWNSCKGKVWEVCSVLCVGTLGKLEFMSGKSPGSLLCPMCGNPVEIGIHVREKSGKFVLSCVWEPWGNLNSCKGKVREVCCVLCVGTLGKLEFMSGKSPGSLLCPVCGNPGEIGIHVREKSGKFVLSCVWEPCQEEE